MVFLDSIILVEKRLNQAKKGDLYSVYSIYLLLSFIPK